MAEQNIRLLIEYNGSHFSGWQIQENAGTVQGEITDAIRKVTGQTVTLIGAGRTDAGVHARGQVANFHIQHELEPQRYREALNFHLPSAILIRESRKADIAFHSRFDAVNRRYRYLLTDERSALYRSLRWERTGGAIDKELLDLAASAIMGEHDFSPFCVSASLKESNLCRVDHSQWRKVGPLLVYEIRGNRFLHGMVRSLVGAMVNIAALNKDRHPGNLTLDTFKDMLTSPATARNPFSAPAHGLYLLSVAYIESRGKA